MEKKSFSAKLDAFFHVSERKSTVKTELSAGLVTFLAMCYILMVNANFFASLPEVSYGAMYVATGIAAVIGTVLTGLMANLPFAQASGMGLNAFVVYTLCFGLGFTYSNAMVMVLLDGVVFIIMTVTGLRKKIFDAIPSAVRHAITVGIGLFIVLIGLSGTVLQKTDGGMPITSMFNFDVISSSFAGAQQLLIALCLFAGFLAIGIMGKKNVKGSVLFGILISTVLYYIAGLFIKVGGTSITAAAFSGLNLNPLPAFKAWANEAFLQVFTKGFDFSAYIANNSVVSLIGAIVSTVFAFAMCDMFDTIGTMYGTAARGGLLDENGDIPNFNEGMLADAIATCTGAIIGTSTVTTFVESASGVAEGGRTGLTAITTAVLFLIALFFSPITALIPGCATSAALCYVGVLMMANVKDVDWLNLEEAIPAFVTMSMTVFGYSISKGIGLGLISFVIMELCLGKGKSVKVTTYILATLFAALLLLTSM